MKSILFAFSELRLFHPGAEILDDEIEGRDHEVVGASHDRWLKREERVGESGKMKAEDAIEQSCGKLVLNMISGHHTLSRANNNFDTLGTRITVQWRKYYG